MVENCYEVLGVSRTASQEEIKNAYRQLIRQVHPDTLATASAYWKRQAEEKAKDANEAYRVLSDPARRRLYDQQLDAYQQSQRTSAQPTPRPNAGPTRARTRARSPNAQAGGAKQKGTNQGQPRSNTTSQQTGSQQTQSPPNTTQPKSNTSYQSGQAQQSTPPPSPPPQATSTPPPHVSAVPATPPSRLRRAINSKPFWAIWCLMWGGLWSWGLYARTSDDFIQAFAVAFVCFCLAAWAYRGFIANTLSRVAITAARVQVYITCGIILFLLTSILILGASNDPLASTRVGSVAGRQLPRVAPSKAAPVKSNDTLTTAEQNDPGGLNPDSPHATPQEKHDAIEKHDSGKDQLTVTQPELALSASDFTLDVRAEEPSWVQVRTDGNSTWEGELAENATKSFHASKELVVKLGNASGVELSYNGKLLPRFSPENRTKTLTFTPDGLSSR